MDALVLAGGNSSVDDPLFQYTDGKPKSLINVAGKPITQWVLDAVTESKHINHIHLIGLNEKSGLTSQKPLHFIPDQGDVIANVKLGFKEIKKTNSQATQILLSSGDIPMINQQIVDWRIETADRLDKDIHYAVVKRETMEARFPGANRTYLRLKDGEYCGADMNVVRLAALEKETIWNRLAESRKSPLKQAALIGFDTLFLILVRQLTLHKAEKMVCDRMGLQAEVVISPYAEIAMDIDKPHQLELLHAELEEREGSRT